MSQLVRKSCVPYFVRVNLPHVQLKYKIFIAFWLVLPFNARWTSVKHIQQTFILLLKSNLTLLQNSLIVGFCLLSSVYRSYGISLVLFCFESCKFYDLQGSKLDVSRKIRFSLTHQLKQSLHVLHMKRIKVASVLSRRL